jgi:hypothetical protein
MPLKKEIDAESSQASNKKVKYNGVVDTDGSTAFCSGVCFRILMNSLHVPPMDPPSYE